MNTQNIKTVEDKIKSHFIPKIEFPYLQPDREKKIEVGNIVRIGYKIQEGEKERIQYYEGLIIAIQNRGLGKSFTIRRNVQGIGVEQLFPVHSPKILSLVKKQASKVRRAKLYFLRFLTGKAAKLRVKFS
jgi:large subunit ribosomal protein L19